MLQQTIFTIAIRWLKTRYKTILLVCKWLILAVWSGGLSSSFDNQRWSWCAVNIMILLLTFSVIALIGYHSISAVKQWFFYIPSPCNIFQRIFGFVADSFRAEFVTLGLSHILCGMRVNTLISRILCVCLTLYRNHNGILCWNPPGRQEWDGGNGAWFFSCPVFFKKLTRWMDLQSEYSE